MGHLEGLTGKSLWWVRAVDEFFCAFNSSSLIHREKIQNTTVDSPPLKSIDEAPSVNIREDGLVTAFGHEPSSGLGNEQLVEDDNGTVQQEPNATTRFDSVCCPNINAMMVPVKNCLNQLSRRSKISMWVLACVAITTTWPILGSLLFKKKLRKKHFTSSSMKR